MIVVGRSGSHLAAAEYAREQHAGKNALFERRRAAARAYPESGYTAVSLDSSVSFHRFNPECDWLLVDHECPIAGRGLMGVSGRVWGRDGRLLAGSSAQLCCVAQR